ncbi:MULTISPECIES: hypothetical protein [unclassified Nostoc]|uniref:COG1470 family protein n=1 Tax=unclassified Nostoc TaxID=2593658 RepID=UPI002AD2C472|nr:hypothetical protein [Nostoc sp. DedQUE03]MDZ7971004.1 hypothetical protein [Nostoc sp. DedQUE03]MDZ8046821.1 hypothetical protein [Nostoc sp. DedQUE02]
MLSKHLDSHIDTQLSSSFLNSTRLKPLFVILSASGKDAVSAGSTFVLSVTLGNKGKQSAVIEVYIEEISSGVRSWCTSGREYLALGSEQSEEVVFTFHVPVDTLPGTYNYILVVDAHEHYPEDTPIRYEQYIQVLPATNDIVNSSEPTFILQPVSSSTNPAVIQQGGALAVQVLVQNRGDRVDRFRLVCFDLPKSWFTITYPQGFQGAGLIVQSDSLNLNPGECGVIMLAIAPGMDALSGNYVPTLRLYSENYPNSIMLDLVYLQVPPRHLLQTELRSIISRVRTKPGLFQVQLTNSGNIERQISLQVKNLDELEIYSYTLEQSQALVQPQETVGINLQVQPQKWWRRPLMGGGRIVNFCVDLEDLQHLPIPNNNLPGVLVWEARPLWQLLPFLLLGLLSLGAVAYLIWWVLFRIPPSPKIVELYPEDTTYSAVNGDVVHLGWQISDVNRLQTLKIVGLSVDGTPLTRPEVYDFNQGVPAELQPFCTKNQSSLTCRQVRTSARKSATYVFEMTALPKPGRGAVTDIGKTSPVTIVPIPQPSIVVFNSTQPIYQEVRGQETGEKRQKVEVGSHKSKGKTEESSKLVDDEIRLNWSVTHPEQLQSLQIIGRTPDNLIVSPVKTYDFSQGIPHELRRLCTLAEQLVCQKVKTGIKKPGSYVFALKAIPKGDENDKIEPKQTEVIKILPRPPRILKFTINGKPVNNKYLIPISKDKKVLPLIFAWQVDASDSTQVQLLPAPGSVPLKGSISLNPGPKPSTMTLMLQVTTTTGQQQVRSLILETYDPQAKDPAVAAAEAMGQALINAQKAATDEEKKADTVQKKPQQPSKEEDEEDINHGSDVKQPPTLFPFEQPPQFDR